MRIAIVLLLTLSATAADAQYVEVRGLRMYYSIHGEGTPVVLLHGGAGSIENWKAQIAELSRAHRVIAIEQMGHGRTADDPSRDLSYDSMAEDTGALLAKLGVANADFVGWSDGGQLALRLAFTHPKLVRKVVASGVALGFSACSGRSRRWMETVKSDEVPAEIREAYRRLAPHPEHWAAFFERLRRMWLRPTYGVSERELRTITAPTLIISGDDDMAPLEHSVTLTRWIPGAQLCVLPGTGHDTFAKRAAWLNPIVLEFLDAPISEAKE